MSAHIHADLMLQYAQDAAETDKPWKRWDVSSSGNWYSCNDNPEWNVSCNYRRKQPATKVVVLKCWYRPSHTSVIWSAADQTSNGCIHQPRHDITVEVPV